MALQHLGAFFNLFVLPDEPDSELSPLELKCRKGMDRLYRFLIASFFAYYAFDFLFNPIWMHGYVWSLNLPIDLDMADKSAGLIVAHQLKQCGYAEKLLHAMLFSSFMMLMLWRCGFTARSQRMSTLMSLAVTVGILLTFVRGLQMKQRLFSAIHEGCYALVMTFIVGTCLTIRMKSDPIHRFEKAETSEEKNEVTVKEDSEKKTEEKKDE